MHEVAILAIPALAGPAYAVRAWLGRRRAPRNGAVILGQRLPAWGPLPAVDGGYWGPKDLRGVRATVFVFMSNRCPGVKAYDRRLAKLADEFGRMGVRFIGVNSVPAALYPGESRAHMATAARERGLTFPYVKDESQALMRVLGATCTPQAFVVDEGARLRYRGRIDDAFLENRVKRSELRDALEAITTDVPVRVSETHAIGCSIDAAPHRSRAAHRVRPSRLAAAAV